MGADRHVNLHDMLSPSFSSSAREELHCEGETRGRFTLSPTDRPPSDRHPDQSHEYSDKDVFHISA